MMIPDHVRRFRDQGFVHVRSVLELAALAPLAEAVDRAVAHRKRNDRRLVSEKSPYEQSFIQCISVWEDFADIRPLTFHPAVAGLAAELLGAQRVRLWHDQALYKEAGGRETEAHQDLAYWPIAEARTVTAWIPLQDVDEASGCMGYVPGSHLSAVEYVDIFKTPGEGAELMAKRTLQPVFVPARAGDVIFHDGRTVHMARPNPSERTRRAYTAIYFADGCTRSSDMWHPAVDRTGIAVGAVIDGAATPLAWPLEDGRLPEPPPWPALSEHERKGRAKGLIPG
jgi:ectoine hydroxylase-related dioxygenase (phytanoyl-CoA dioxygenase family)